MGQTYFVFGNKLSRKGYPKIIVMLAEAPAGLTNEKQEGSNIKQLHVGVLSIKDLSKGLITGKVRSAGKENFIVE